MPSQSNNDSTEVRVNVKRKVLSRKRGWAKWRDDLHGFEPDDFVERLPVETRAHFSRKAITDIPTALINGTKHVLVTAEVSS